MLIDFCSDASAPSSLFQQRCSFFLLHLNVTSRQWPLWLQRGAAADIAGRRDQDRDARGGEGRSDRGLMQPVYMVLL